MDNDPEPNPTDTIADPPKTPVDKPTSFSQEEVNAMMGRVRLEERGKYTDYDDLKAKAAKAEEYERAQMTDAQRLTADVERSKQRVADLEGDIADVRIGAEITVMAAQMGIVDPEAALALINRAGITYRAEEGVSGVKEALGTLVSEKSYLVGKATAPNINSGPGAPGPVAVKLSEGQRNAAHKLFPNMPLDKAEAEYTAGMR